MSSTPNFEAVSEAVFGCLPIAVALFEKDFTLRYCNPTWANLVTSYANVSSEHIRQGKHFFDLMPGAEASLTDYITKAAQGEEVQAEALQLKYGDEITYWEISFTPLPQTYSGAGVICVMSDITQKILTHQQSEARAQASAFQVSTLLDVTRSMVRLNKDPLLDHILDRLQKVVDYNSALFLHVEEQNLVVVAVRSPQKTESDLNTRVELNTDDLLTRLIKEEGPSIISDTRDDLPEVLTFRNFIEDLDDKLDGKSTWSDFYKTFSSWMIVPLIIKDQITGILAIGHSQIGYYTEHDARLLQAFADYATIAQENDRLYQRAHHLATLEERDRLARELHDNLAQSLGYLNLKLSVIQDLLGRKRLNEAQQELSDLKQLASETYTDIREEIFSLRSTASSKDEFFETLNTYLNKYRTYYHIDVEVILDEDEKETIQFPPNTGNQIIRIIQEALINIRKHAQVNRAFIHVNLEADQIQFTIEDQGAGFDPNKVKTNNQSGYGLQIMRERAESVGGNLNIESSPGRGSKVILWVPANYNTL